MHNQAIKYFKDFYNDFIFPIQIFDSQGNLIFLNKAFSTQWGYEISELESYNIFNDILLSKSAVIDIIKKSFKEKVVSEIDDYSDSIMRKSGKVLLPLFKTQILPISFEQESYFVFIHTDRTEAFLAETELKKARENSNEAERLKNTFLNVLSHELRTPLNIILGYSTIIKESLKDRISAEEKVYLENLYNGSERLFKSISQMLEFAQLEAGNYHVSIETIDLVSIIKNNLDAFRQQALQKSLNLTLNIKEESILVDSDLHCVENALQNLLNNALKFTSSGFIEVEAGIMKDHELAFCKIRDSGIGISSDYLDHLYTPFSQEDLKLSRNYEGNGLGLAITKRYIERVGGSLIVDSIKGVGSTFTITLPLSKKVTATSKNIFNTEQQKVKKILMLDDSGETLELVKVFAKDTAEIYSHPFEKFVNFLYKNDFFQLVILDINLNRWQDGLELCKEIIKKDPYKRPVLILSGETDKNKINEFYRAGATKFLIKPFTKADLLESIGLVLT